jgi:hypothetical protein
MSKEKIKAILEMEVPESCDICPFYKFLYGDMNKKCLALDKYHLTVQDKNRHPDCPLKIVEDNKEEL